jgi:hypothetical protein
LRPLYEEPQQAEGEGAYLFFVAHKP